MAKKPVKYSLVDAFTESPFKGNPAAVCLLEEYRDEQWLQSVAAEFNISETCYLTRITESEEPYDSPHHSSIPRFRLRWFTPVAEVILCGHATLAAAHTLFLSGKIDSDVIEFVTLSGILTAKRVPEHDESLDIEKHKSFFIELNFPSDPNTEFNSAEVSLTSKALGGASVIDIKRTTTLDYLIVVVPSAKAVTDLQPDFDAIGKYPGRGTIVTGVAPPESGFDFYSRFFSPQYGINEDPVTGSAHCSLASYWSKELGKCDFVAYQASPRGGVLNIHLDEQKQRVLLRGKAFTVMEGTISV
ncbi:Phenazine biosynthesis protein [Parasponia andersonii]|uniref:Phenazine biosynthesis protein n=1 Tax=Parasponia andersonii TaxID=3476 RepID=A0A2P5CXL7_PARAD|nr:Phenazine biosynthesis protein [Parasponia andersonii]